MGYIAGIDSAYTIYSTDAGATTSIGYHIILYREPRSFSFREAQLVVDKTETPKLETKDDLLLIHVDKRANIIREPEDGLIIMDKGALVKYQWVRR